MGDLPLNPPNPWLTFGIFWHLFTRMCLSNWGNRAHGESHCSTVVGHPATANCQSIFWGGEDLSNRGVGYSGYNATHKTGGA
jgi:hypothetical protein